MVQQACRTNGSKFERWKLKSLFDQLNDCKKSARICLIVKNFPHGHNFQQSERISNPEFCEDVRCRSNVLNRVESNRRNTFGASYHQVHLKSV